MKKTILILILILLFTLYQFSGSTKSKNTTSRFSIQINGSYIQFSDDDYKKVYSEGTFYPDLKIGYVIYKKIYLWSSMGILSAAGNIEELDTEAKSKQTYLKSGLGYKGNISKKFGYSFDLGGFLAKYKEEAFGEETSESVMGYSIGINLNYSFSKHLYAEIGLNYIIAEDTVKDKSFKIGGINSFIGIGYRF